ncbi:MAG: DUF3800 domain-containing protein [Nanoarchaeota archaeon]|nr:DUF3800 domain-containing protein [Nanoarchaeota archaeon]
MIFGFLDESGSNYLKASKCLIAVLIIVKDIYQIDITLTKKKRLYKDIKKVFEESKGEFKFNIFMKHIKKSAVKNYLLRILKKISKLDVEIYVNVVNKLLYKYATQKAKNNLVLDYCSQNFSHVYDNQIKIFADKEFYKPAFDILYLGLEKEKLQRIGITDNINKVKNLLKEYKIIEIQHMDSKQSKGLQLADLICGSIFQYYEKNNGAYFNIIKNKIKRIEENV